jgi:hypothetical protein
MPKVYERLVVKEEYRDHDNVPLTENDSQSNAQIGCMMHTRKYCWDLRFGQIEQETPWSIASECHHHS